MAAKSDPVDAWLQTLDPERREVMQALRKTVRDHLPEGFAEEFASGMIHYVVPHSLYPAGYHCNPQQALPFISLAAQRSHYALYHMGLYANPEWLAWFQDAWSQHAARKLDMGKSCIRFKKPEHIPHALLGELVARIPPSDWIAVYEQHVKK
jgi:hypothetical protein